LLPYDYQSGEFGNYGEGTSTGLLRIFAAMGLATDLKTVTSEAIRAGLSTAVDTGREVVECLKEASEAEMLNLPADHYLKRNLSNQ
jgi:stearoyl-CoA desaturase (Delta-9 desaturase)